MRNVIERATRRLARQAATRWTAIPRVLERVGAYTLADHADRQRGGGDIVAIALPPSAHDWRSRRIKAFRRQGLDQCVEAFHQGGWWGYERPLPDVLLTTVRTKPGVVVDVGANTGVYALIAASARGRITVHAFEAYPPVARMLRENLALNGTSTHVRVVEAAASDVDGYIDLFVPETSGVIETSCSIESDFRPGSTPIRVRTARLDDYWDSIGRPDVTVIKIDVEGAEHRVLLGARLLLARTRPVVFHEVLPGADFESLENNQRALDMVDVRLSRWEAVVNDRIVFHDLALNHAMVPRERLADFLAPLPGLGLKVTLLD